MSFCLARLDVDVILDGTMYPLEFQCKKNGFWLLWYRQRQMTPSHPSTLGPYGATAACNSANPVLDRLEDLSYRPSAIQPDLYSG